MIPPPPRSTLFPYTTLFRSKLIGASPSLLSQIENGKVTPSVDTLYLLAGALGSPVAAFFGDGDTDATGPAFTGARVVRADEDRKSTRLNSSHSQISYAVFCL